MIYYRHVPKERMYLICAYAKSAQADLMREQQAKSAKLDAAIAANLKELGYGG